jgi:hypothetical protein
MLNARFSITVLHFNADICITPLLFISDYGCNLVGRVHVNHRKLLGCFFAKLRKHRIEAAFIVQVLYLALRSAMGFSHMIPRYW